MIIVYATLAALSAYIVGSIPTAYLVGKFAKRMDIRREGSGNVGATNVFRVIGVKWGFFVLACDIVKGLFVVTLLYYIWSLIFPPLTSIDRGLKIGMGFAAIAGHNWTIFLNFKGGKGIATSTGAFLGIIPGVVGLCAIVWGIVFLACRYVSLASIICGLSAPIFVFILHRHKSDLCPLLIPITLLALGIIYTHRSNIRRLIKGEEKKVRFSRKSQ
ncbi:MAG: glycerol-3-phosphate 1-O-acyltransferase PlsY [Candidatus Omnitrophica bacterium]|nr:glycerol-3-phosphate 1-O-acyltransferase PlsY [Candidatus Omnitrophota bacterium]